MARKFDDIEENAKEKSCAGNLLLSVMTGNHQVMENQETGNMSKRLGITVFLPRLKVCTFARTNSYEYGKQRQVQESP